MLRRHLLALAVIAAPAAASAQAQEVNVYSARHYDTDAQLYEAFTRATGIRVRTIQGDADQLVARIQSEGANSPADVFITVDATRLARATEAGILQPYALPAVPVRLVSTHGAGDEFIGVLAAGLVRGEAMRPALLAANAAAARLVSTPENER